MLVTSIHLVNFVCRD